MPRSCKDDEPAAAGSTHAADFFSRAYRARAAQLNRVCLGRAIARADMTIRCLPSRLHRPKARAGMSDSRTKRGRVSPPWWALLSLATVPAFAAPPSAPKPDPALDVYAAPAQRVDIGKGRHLNLRCSGQGEPTVIL